MKVNIKLVVYGYGYFGMRTARLLSRKYPAHAIVEVSETARSVAKGDFPNSFVVDDVNNVPLDYANDVYFLKDSSTTGSKLELLDWCKRNQVNAFIEKPLGWNDLMLEGYDKFDFAVDLQENFNPTVLILRGYLERHHLKIRSARFFRMNTMHLERMLWDGYRSGVLGGSMIDKMIHDSSILLCTLFPRAKVKHVKLNECGILSFAPYNLDTFLGREEKFQTLGGDVCDINDNEIADMSMTINFGLLFVDEDPINVELISSWAGLPLENPFYPDIPQRVQEDALMVFEVEGQNLKKDIQFTLKKQNMKVFYMDTVNESGDNIKIFGNYQKRAYVSPFIYVQNKTRNESELIKIPPDIIPSIEAFEIFVNSVMSGKPFPIDSNRMIESHRLLFCLRNMCLQSCSRNLSVETQKISSIFNQYVLLH